MEITNVVEELDSPVISYLLGVKHLKNRFLFLKIFLTQQIINEYTEFRDEMKVFPNFSIREIEKHFPGFDSRRLVEWQQKGYIQKLRNRYYYFSDQKVEEPFLYYTANQLYHPSYVSLESALSRYGFIPEGVFQITSCTTLKTNSFNTPIGNFSYRHLKPSLFFGYQLKEWNDHRYAMAEPEKR